MFFRVLGCCKIAQYFHENLRRLVLNMYSEGKKPQLFHYLLNVIIEQNLNQARSVI